MVQKMIILKILQCGRHIGNRRCVKLEDILKEKDGKFLCPGYEHHDKDDGYVKADKICGCHVQRADAQGNVIDDTMYITPMCSSCNQRNDVFQIGKKAIVKRYRN